MTKYNTPVLWGTWLTGVMITLAPLASAGTIGINGGSLIVGTESGDGQQSIVGTTSGTNLLISGVNFDLVTPGCSGSGPGSFLCPVSGFNQLLVLGGDGDDVIDLTRISAPSFAITILGGAGADLLLGSGHHDRIFGDTGDDVLIGGPGTDCLNGGPGDNVLIGGGCNAGTEPVIAPLPRANAPEPAGLLLVASGLGVLPMMRRKLLSITSAQRPRRETSY
jgi:Ca2+-binding RTX toxin-like protein